MDDLYSDDSDESPAPEESREENEDSTQSTALLPKNFFQGKELEAGKRCEVEIVSEHESEVEVKYVKHSGAPERKRSNVMDDESLYE